MSEESKKPINAISMNTVQLIINYIEDNLLERLTPGIIAKQFYLSVSTLNNLFKIVCDMTIMEYIRNRRLSLAGYELLISNIHIINLAYKYGYETPEAFTKAFTRFHGIPPSFVRRTYPDIKIFSPLLIKIEIQGGWKNTITSKDLLLTNQNSSEQEQNSFYCYDGDNKLKGGVPMENTGYKYHIRVKEMQQKEDWNVLLLLAKKLDQGQIKFKVDGGTMVFAHGLEFKLEKICLTFKWNEEQRIIDFFHYDGKAKSTFNGFKYFDVIFEGMKVRCMFYDNNQGNDTDESLYRNADLVDVDGQNIYVQSLEFYYENTEPNTEYYKVVEQWLHRK
ncbi:helix-turn-helix domain-containing protein [Anaerocolumna sp. MB42-C2]|uniref:helix-turn-helix domain-containing protein n=1 Tax=Anaerocolumna sp. MB42-C2 TaxID=3070997 RepID=UPI0027DFB4EC|nr:AraC family transcriptional regulator [Anaerocolumna sp. MB42-C2]WMJ87449.1 AraC family transcriptional regulator [Anaerocolumna sp. MB42-C2]